MEDFITSIFENETVVVRQFRGIGIDRQLNGYNLETGERVNKHYCNGGVRYKIGKKVASLNQLRKQPRVYIIINEKLPF